MLLLAVALTSSAVEILHGMVDDLGSRSDVRSLERLSRYGCQAVPYLVKNLKPVSAITAKLSNETSNETMKVVWTIAALRYITGKDFRSRYATISSEAGRQALKSGGSGGKLFGVWMSRELVYFNGIAGQREIIAKWKKFSQENKCKNGTINRDVVFWMNGVSF